MAGISAQGSTIEINTGTSLLPVWVEIGGVKSFSTPENVTSEIDVTHLGSVSMEYIGGIADGGNFSYEGLEMADDPGQVAMKAARTSRAVTGLRVTLPNLDIVTFDVLVKSISVTVGVNAALTMKMDSKVTGPVVAS